MAAEADKEELRLNILVTPEGNGVLYRVLEQIDQPKRRAKHLLHLALTGLYAEAFLHSSPAVLSRGVEPHGEAAAPALRSNPSSIGTGSVKSASPGAPAQIQPADTAPAVSTKGRAGLDLVDIQEM